MNGAHMMHPTMITNMKRVCTTCSRNVLEINGRIIRGIGYFEVDQEQESHRRITIIGIVYSILQI